MRRGRRSTIRMLKVRISRSFSCPRILPSHTMPVPLTVEAFFSAEIFKTLRSSELNSIVGPEGLSSTRGISFACGNHDFCCQQCHIYGCYLRTLDGCQFPKMPSLLPCLGYRCVFFWLSLMAHFSLYASHRSAIWT